MRLIDVSEYDLKGGEINWVEHGEHSISIRRESLYKIPTVDAAPVVHGRWQWLSSTYDRTPCEMRYMCDKCHHETITHGHEPWEKYCPNCGARMDLEEQDAQTDQPGK